MKVLLLLLLLVAPVAAQDMAYPTLYEGTISIPSEDAEIKDLKWHKWTTQNFVILSISEVQGKFLANNVENIKSLSLSKWGIPINDASNFRFSAECRIFSVPDKTLMKKLFRVEASRVEIKRQQGNINLSLIWLLLDDSPMKTVPAPVTEVCLNELNQRYNNKINYCILRGMSLLNGSVENTRAELLGLNQYILNSKNIYFSKSLFEMTFDQWEKLSAENKKIFDRECMVLCLLLRKEFGEDKIYRFFTELKTQSTENSLKSIYGFLDYKQFDSSLIRYMKDLGSDIVNKTPDSYLEIKAK